MADENKVQKAAEAAMDEVEENIFKYLDGQMFHHLSQQKGTSKKLNLPKSKLEFSIKKDGEFCFGLKGVKPYSEEAKAYERKDFANVLKGMAELDKEISILEDAYKECMRVAKEGKGDVPDVKKAIKEVAKVLAPYNTELEKIYAMEKVV